MSESFITQCPHCGTSFRVRDEQLSVANGSVRCGACLQVFSARNHVVQADASAAKSATHAKAAKPTKASVAPPAKKPAPAKPAAKPTPPPAPPPGDSGFNFAADDDEEFIFADGEEDDDFLFGENDSDSLFDEDESSDGLGEFSDTFMNLNETPSSHSKQSTHFQNEAREMSQDILDDNESDDESWAESMLEEIEKEDKPVAQPKASFRSRDVAPASKTARAPVPPKPAPQPERTTAVNSSILDFDDPISIPSKPQRPPSASTVVRRASNELDVDFHPEERLSRLRPLGWLIISLLLITLMAQLAWLQRNTYARMDQWRGLYEQACNLLGCELPAQIDVSMITSTLLVRDHKDPQLSDIMIADIVLTNKAAFKQQFPEVILQFTSTDGKLLADQSFLPEDYLKGEMTGVDVMPINTRIYISLPIKRPPSNAVNRQLVLRGTES